MTPNPEILRLRQGLIVPRPVPFDEALNNLHSDLQAGTTGAITFDLEKGADIAPGDQLAVSQINVLSESLGIKPHDYRGYFRAARLVTDYASLSRIEVRHNLDNVSRTIGMLMSDLVFGALPTDSQDAGRCKITATFGCPGRQILKFLGYGSFKTFSLDDGDEDILVWGNVYQAIVSADSL